MTPDSLRSQRKRLRKHKKWCSRKGELPNVGPYCSTCGKKVWK